MPAKRITPLLLGSSLAASSTFAFALGLGEATPRSALGEPLQLNIPINIAPGEEVGEHCFTLRAAPFNQASGLPTITHGSVSVMRSAAGKAVLRVSTSTPVDEPMVAIGIETRCKINVARDYSIFLSPRIGDDGITPLTADGVWDVPASHPAVETIASDAPAAPLAGPPSAHDAPAPLAPAASTVAAAPVVPGRPVVLAAAPRPAATAAAPAAVTRPGPALAKAQPVAAAKPLPTMAAPAAPAQPLRAAAPAPRPAVAAAPAQVAVKPAAIERDAQLAELTATVNALRAQVAAQEKRLQELATPAAAPLRVAGQYRPDSVIPASLNVPIARSDAQTVVYRAAPMAAPQSPGVSLEMLGIALLVTALAAAGSGHYIGRRAAESAAGQRQTRTGRRPVRRPRD